MKKQFLTLALVAGFASVSNTTSANVVTEKCLPGVTGMGSICKAHPASAWVAVAAACAGIYWFVNRKPAEDS